MVIDQEEPKCIADRLEFMLGWICSENLGLQNIITDD